MDAMKEMIGMLGAQAYGATGDERFLKIAAEATTAAADGLKADNDAALQSGRFNKLAAIEASIMAAKPDFLEAAEIVDAIRATIERREMPESVREELATYGKAFRDALDRADEVVPQ